MKDELIGIGLAIFVVWVIFLCSSGILTGIAYFVDNGVQNEVKGTVIAVEQTNFISPHTDVTFKTFSDSSIKYTFSGYQNFTIGDNYDVKMTTRFTVIFPAIPLPMIYGDINSIEQLP
jgi:hypothetical protein